MNKKSLLRFLQPALNTSLAMVCAAIMAPNAAHAIWLDTFDPADPMTFEPNDGGGDGSGSFFDLTAASNVQLTGISAFSNAGDGNAYTIDVWYRTGTTVGNELSMTGWMLLESFNGTNTLDLTVDLLTLTTPFSVGAGDTVGFAVAGTTGGLQWYDTTDPATYTDGTVSVTVPDGTFPAPAEAKGFDTLFSDTDRLRSFAGSVHYEPAQMMGVPEPGSALGLLLMGLGGLCVVGFRTRTERK